MVLVVLSGYKGLLVGIDKNHDKAAFCVIITSLVTTKVEDKVLVYF